MKRFSRLFCFLVVVMPLICIPVLATGRPCPTERGACFVQLPEGLDFFIFDEIPPLDDDGDTDFIRVFLDGFSDFITVFPDGREFAHAIEENASLIYCPFPLFDDEGNTNPPDDTCVFGTGRLNVNGFLGGAFGFETAAGQIDGAGVRPLDGAQIDVSAEFVVDGQGRLVRFRIEP